LKKLKGVVTVSLPRSFLTPPSAENDALRKAAAAKENTDMMIPQPPSRSGVAGNRFNLQAAMRLQNDTNMYIALCVS
jgi:hypothetical protein